MSLLDFLPLTVTLVGGFLLIKLRAFFIIRPSAILRELKNALSTKGAVRSLCLALAGTLGVGNIIGVAVGLIVGGAGSVFWLMLSSLFATVLKYSEACISQDISGGCGGGMLIPLKRTFSRVGKILSSLYALLALMLAFSMGGALQSVGAVGALSVSTGMNEAKLSIVFALITAVILLLVKREIKSLTVFVIPLVTAIYIALSMTVIALNLSKLPEIISLIFRSAVNRSAATGGTVGFLASVSVREGFSRGLLSNEAGAGTSSLSHSETSATPAGTGILGMCEVFFDTVVLCPMTAIAILSVIPDVEAYSTGGELVISAFRLSLGTFASNIIAICILLFAFSTVLCWFYYGNVCSKYLHLPTKLYTALFLVSLVFGSRLGERFIVLACDAILLFLTLLTGSVLIKNSDRIKHLSELSGLL